MSHLHSLNAKKSGLMRKRCLIFLSLLALVGLYLLLLIFKMQVFDYEIYQKKVLDQITVGSSLQAERGCIYDRNGTLLAGNRTSWRIYLSPIEIKKSSRLSGKDYASIIANGLADILSLSYDTIYEKAQKSAYLDQTLVRGAQEDTYRAVLAFVTQNGLSSMVRTEAGVERYYPFSTLAAHTIGFTGSDGQGLFGLEAYYQPILAGVDGRYVSAVDSRGIELPIEYSDYVEGERGADIILTLDTYVQKQLEASLAAAMLAADAQNRVTGIAMNPKTGEILAMATAPSFDLNDPYTLDSASLAKLAAANYDAESSEYKTLKQELLYTMWGNKAVNEIYEPGSTFKIVTVSAALETGAVSVNDRFSCPGYYTVGGCRISCHKRGGHGTLTFAEGLQQSCNPSMMQAAERMGKESFYQYICAFGYREKTGIDLPGEASGIFHSLSAIGSTELATTSFGQRFKVSVLQQLCAVSAVANGGTLVTPHLLQSVLDGDGQEIYRYETQEKRTVISAETAATVCEILEGGVSGNGGAKNAYVEGYGVAAKTGTSEKFEILDANGNSYLRIASCVGFAPYDDAEIAVIIVVDEPTCTVKYGSAVAAPYVSMFLSSVLPYLGIEPTQADTEATVADCVGLSPSKASALLSKSELRCRIIGEGESVISQFPAYGTRLQEGGCVILYTEEGANENTSVPSLVGKTLQEANELLLKAGLNIHIEGNASQSLPSNNAVATQSLPPGTSVPSGTVITVRFLYTDHQD